MATKTLEEKALTRAAVALRQAAYHQRVSALQAAEAEAAKVAANSPEHAAHEAARNAMDAVVAERNAKIEAIRVQIAQLQDQSEAIRREYLPIVESAREARSQALDELGRARDAAREKALESFADIEGAYGPAQWKPLDEFLKLAAEQPIAPSKPKRTKSAR